MSELALLWSTVALATPLVLAAMGGYTSERSGIINIGLEGKMLAAACATAAAAPALGAMGGILCGIAFATALSLLHWLATQKYRIDHVVSGMAVNALAAGGTNFAAERFMAAGQEVPRLPIAVFAILGVLLPALLYVHEKTTRSGLRLLSVGGDPDKARLMGVQPLSVRFGALLATGIFTGLAGAMLVNDTGRFTDNMTAGRGYIALAALILGAWRPLPTLIACLVFGFLTSLQIQFQGVPVLGIELPSQAWSALPYVATVVALAGFLGKQRAPAGLGKP